MWQPNRLDGRDPAATWLRTPTLIYAEFFLTGVVTALLGPILPALRAHFGVSDAQAGILFVAQFAASSVGALFSQLRSRFSVLLGLALMAGGVIALPLRSWEFAQAAVALFGLGLGFVIPATNMYVASSSGPDRAASLNVLNFVWGAGAATTPLVIAFLQRWVGLKDALLLIAAAIAAVFAMLMIFPPPARSAIERRHSPSQTSQARELSPLVVFCFMLFLYIGVETTIGGWTATYVRELGIRNTLFQSLALFCFWLALLGGRAFAPVTLRVLPESPLFRISLLVAFLGIGFLISSRTLTAATASAFVVGAGLAPLFALTVALLSRHTESRGTRVPGWVFSIAGMGGAALPWLVGVVTTHFRSMRTGLFVALAACLLLFLLHLSQAAESGSATREGELSGA